MSRKYAVILVDNEESCTVKQVDKNTFIQARDMRERGEDDNKIITSLVQLSIRRENTFVNGVNKEDAIQYAHDAGEEYIVLQSR